MLVNIAAFKEGKNEIPLSLLLSGQLKDQNPEKHYGLPDPGPERRPSAPPALKWETRFFLICIHLFYRNIRVPLGWEITRTTR
jgi:hypothetical protein